MDNDFELKIIRNIGALATNLKENCLLRVVTSLKSNTYYIYFLSCLTQITCSELSFDKLNSSSQFITREVTIQNSQKAFTLSILKILHLPITVHDLVASNKYFWAFGKEGFINIAHYFKNIFPDLNSEENYDLIEAPMDEDVHLRDFESVVKFPDILRHNFQDNYFCFNCDLSDNSVIVCYTNYETQTWNLILVISNSTVANDDIVHIPLLDFPLSYVENKSSIETSFKDKPKQCWKPEILFCSLGHNIWNYLFETDERIFSNYVCLIGHPEGKIMYSLCSWSTQYKEFKLIGQLQQLYDLKQSVLGVDFIESICDFKEFLIIVGEHGKLIFITSEQFFKDADSIVLTNGSLSIMTFQLPSPVKNYIILSDCIIHSSKKGDIWVTKFISDDSMNNNERKYLKLLTLATDFREIVNITVLDKVKELFLMLTSTGNLYLAQYSSKTNGIAIQKSLPYLMNGVLQQSMHLRNLISLKHLQSKFFAAVSIFANLKFREGKKIQLDCAVTEIEVDPKQLFLNINLKEFEDLNLDPDFWCVTASLHSHFQRDSAIILKSKPLNSGSNLCIEVSQSSICHLNGSLFPLYLEVGLILHLPEKYASLDCFQPIIKKLPLYVRTHTLILTELYLLKNKLKSLKDQKFTNGDTCKPGLEKIFDFEMKSPIYKLLNSNHKKAFTRSNEYTLCLLDSSVKCMFKSSHKESDLAQSIFQLIGRQSSLKLTIDENNLLCRNQPISISVSHRENIIYITVSAHSSILLLGLRMAIAELLLSNQNKSTSEASNCISIPASVHRQCEELSKELSSIFGTDVNKSNFLENALKLYDKIRKEVSEKLPF